MSLYRCYKCTTIVGKKKKSSDRNKPFCDRDGGVDLSTNAIGSIVFPHRNNTQRQSVPYVGQDTRINYMYHTGTYLFNSCYCRSKTSNGELPATTRLRESDRSDRSNNAYITERQIDDARRVVRDEREWRDGNRNRLLLSNWYWINYENRGIDRVPLITPIDRYQLADVEPLWLARGRLRKARGTRCYVKTGLFERIFRSANARKQRETRAENKT